MHVGRICFDSGRSQARLPALSIAFIYGVELVGPALTSCDRNRWEKMDVQFAVLPSGIGQHSVAVTLQAGEGLSWARNE